ncbi:putative uncharacterized protein YGR160W [Cynara cardunculus var. scolymus]|uniref:putative uncharacterized protein YGR160W n=1 Tax=Cynara cardunculus var. scolymus TaxID=59895 RepID=UPI000D62A2A7|nr:putative uncharacterized protein YGR160W [Cynara cardunculus var. scolymus]
MDAVHKAMPVKEYLTHDLSTVKIELLQQPDLVPKPAFTEPDCLQLERVVEFNLLQVEALSNLEHRIEDISLSLNDLTSCLDDHKEGKKDKSEKISMENASDATVVTDEALALILHAEDAITSNEVEDDDEDENEDEESHIPDIRQDLRDDDDDEDDDDEDFTIRYHPRPV